MRFGGKVAIVTGAASGIGRSVAVRLAKEGARVVIADVDLDGLSGTAQLIESQVVEERLDVSDPAACDAIIERSASELGRIDVLCNIAGVLTMAPLENLTPEILARIFGVNVNGVVYMTRAAMPHLLAQRGNVVNMASVAGLAGIPYNSAYCASKHAVVGITRALALELANTGVRVNAVCPTGVNTPMIKNAIPQGIDVAQLMRCSPWLDNGSSCDPEDIADAVAFLASDEARRITGVAFPVDGGQTAA